MFVRASVVAGAFLLVFAPASVAQEMLPLTELVDTSAEPYAMARCGGMYQALMEWSGEARLGAETWAAMDSTRELFIYTASLIHQESTGSSIESAVEATLRDVRNIADLYIARMESNYALNGQAIMQDSVINSDLQFCRSLVDGR